MSRANSDPMGRRRVLRALLAPPLAALAAGCEVPGKGPPPILYRLTPKSTFREDLPTVSWQLVLELPLANAGLSTTRIALYRDPTNLEYYARASWTDRAPGMVLTLEPGMEFAPGKLMVHEENIVVRDGAPELLTIRAPREMPVIG